MIIDYKVARTEDCVLINIANWVCPSEIEIRKMNGKASVSCITEALEVHTHSSVFKNYSTVNKGDYLFFTRACSDIASMRNFDIGDGQKYFNAPFSQIIGKFNDNKVSFGSLEILFNNLLIKKIETEKSGLVLSSNSMVGEVVKVGTIGISKDNKPKPLQIKEGDVVIVKDNAVTEIRLDNNVYYGLNENNVVGTLNYGLSMSDINFINKSILLKPYYTPTILNSKILITPDINYEDLDYSDIFNRNVFKIEYLDKEINNLKKGDIVIVKRDFTEYVYFNQEKYFLLNGEEWVETKIIE
jgi:co-chaperonin GroES (HSP10)